MRLKPGVVQLCFDIQLPIQFGEGHHLWMSQIAEPGPQPRARGVETVHSGSKSSGKRSVGNAGSMYRALTRLRGLVVSGRGNTMVLHAMQRAVLQVVGCRRPNDGFQKLSMGVFEPNLWWLTGTELPGAN